VLGTGARPHWVRQLAEVGSKAAAAATDALVAVHILTYGESLEFAHPIARGVVYDSIPSARRAMAHAHGAQILRRAGADASRIAAQLLLAEPAADPAALATLRKAAEQAQQRGAPEVAATYLSRALLEPTSPDERLSVLLALGRARTRAGDPNGLEDLARARAAADDVRVGAAIALELGPGFDAGRSLAGGARFVCDGWGRAG
jgi:hypothetical protein